MHLDPGRFGPADIDRFHAHLAGQRTQIAVFRPSTRDWFVHESNGATTRIPWGGPGDQPVPAPFSFGF